MKLKKDTKSVKKLLIFVVLSMAFSFVSTVPVLLCVIDFTDQTKQLFTIILSASFWGGLIAEQVFIWLADRLRKRELSKNVKETEKHRVGIASFCKTKAGTVSDIVFAVSFITFVVLFIGGWGISFAQYLCLFLIVLSFRVHCIANGKNYRYILYLQKRREK